MPDDNDLSHEQAFTAAAAAQQTTVPSATVESPPVSAPQAAPPQTDFTELLNLSKSLGYEGIEANNPRELIEKIHSQSMTRAQRLAQHLASQVKPPEQPQVTQTPAPQEPDHWQKSWESPKFDESWFDLVERDPDTGNFVSRADGSGMPLAHPDIVRATNEYARWYSTKQREFFENPYRKVYDVIKDPMLDEVKKLVNSVWEERVAQAQAEQKYSQIEGQYEQHLYQRDQAGQPLVDTSGYLVLSDYGKKVDETMQTLMNSGISDRAAALEWAVKFVGQPQIEQQQAQPEQQKTNGKSFLQSAIQKAAHNASAGGAPPPDESDPAMYTQMELDNLFIKAGGRG